MTKYLLFATACAAQMAYWRLLRRGFRRAQAQARPTGPARPACVVVAARNEEKNLPNLLTALMRQDHPAYEVVVVNDASEDDTAWTAERWPDEGDRIKVISITRPVPPRKKHALAHGIAAANHHLLAFTDADCRPPPGWLKAMTSSYGADGRPVLRIGYSPFRRRSGLLNRIARYETFVTGFFTAAAVGLGKPYMAVGRNMAYPKEVFEAVGGFEHSRQSLSGDDDLLVQEVVRRDAAEVIHVFDPASFVLTEAPSTWQQWLRQKTRHTSASRFYARDVQVHLTLFHASNALLWLAPVFLGWVGAGLLALNLVQRRAVLSEAARVLREEDLLPAQPLLELLYTAYNAFVAPIGVLRMPKRW